VKLLCSIFPVELAKDELQQRGYYVLGGYMSPVNDAYKKKVFIVALQKAYETDSCCSFN
jgi:nicotinamide mononucleotide adenylyltransferase